MRIISPVNYLLAMSFTCMENWSSIRLFTCSYICTPDIVHRLCEDRLPILCRELKV